jgi:hypothetical protein
MSLFTIYAELNSVYLQNMWKYLKIEYLSKFENQNQNQNEFLGG